jgi:hypothetical protein
MTTDKGGNPGASTLGRHPGDFVGMGSSVDIAERGRLLSYWLPSWKRSACELRRFATVVSSWAASSTVEQVTLNH